MRVCVVSLDDPWEQYHGGTARTRLLVESIQKCGHATSLVYVGDDQRSNSAPANVSLRSVPIVPLGERRWAQAFRKYKQRLLPLPTMRGGMIRPLGHLVAECDPEVLVVSQLRAAPYLAFAPQATLWLDQADVWSKLLEREVRTRRGVPRLSSNLQLRAIKEEEKKWFSRAGALSAAGYRDYIHLKTIAPERSATWLPTAVPSQAVPKRDGGRVAGFLANFAFWPNQDAFELLRDHWAPALRRLGWQTVVAGLRSEHLDAKGQLRILGPVENLGDYYSGIDLALAPIRLGGGIKVKVIEALMYGKPVVASLEAVEGFPSDLAECIPVVAAQNPQFDSLALDELRMEHAFDLAKAYFSIPAWESGVRQIVDTLAERRKTCDVS